MRLRTITCPECGTTYMATQACQVGGQAHINCLYCGLIPWRPRRPEYQARVIAPSDEPAPQRERR